MANSSGNVKGGGYGSKVHKEIGYRQGQPAAMRYSPKGVSQIGSSIGDHATERGKALPNGIEPVRAGLFPKGSVGGQTLGNARAVGTVKGPGGSREVQKAGSQCNYASGQRSGFGKGGK
jgi:hypothetical protein